MVLRPLYQTKLSKADEFQRAQSAFAVLGNPFIYTLWYDRWVWWLFLEFDWSPLFVSVSVTISYSSVTRWDKKAIITKLLTSF